MELLTSAIIFFSLFMGNAADPLPGPATDTPVKEVFVGTTPCGQLIRPWYKVAPNEDCARVVWELTLLRDPVTQQPTTYQVIINWHYILPDNNYSQPATKSESTGKWSIVPGTGAYARKVIYQLVPDKSGPTLRFVKLGNDLLHLLDENGRYMRGDPMQSYTFYRTNQ